MSEVTKRALAESLRKMMGNKPLSKITVTDIAKDVGVSRMAFYYHFQDIYDLVDWICREDVAEALEGKEMLPWQFRMRAILEKARGDKGFLMNLYHNVSQERIERYIFYMLQSVISTGVEQQAEGYNISRQDKKFIAEFYQFGLIGVVLNWLRSDMKQTPEELTEALEPLMKDHFRLAAHNYCLERKLNEAR